MRMTPSTTSMSGRNEPRQSPIFFAHRGAGRTKAEHNTLPAFRRALELGASGLESDVALTADGIPVLAHPTFLSRGPRIPQLRRVELPSHIPTLRDLYEHCGTGYDLSLDMAQPRAVEAVVRAAEEFGALDRLWFTYWRKDTLREWRERWPQIHLVYPTIPLSPGRPAGVIQTLADLQVDVINIYHPFCFPSTIRLAHERSLLVFAWGIKRRRTYERMLALGVDGVFGDNVEEMVVP
jgi:glycerophosphoryl diester phosphodiesterase